MESTPTPAKHTSDGHSDSKNDYPQATKWRWPLVLGLLLGAGICGAAVGLIYFMPSRQSPPTAEAQILVMRKDLGEPLHRSGSDQPSATEDHVSTHMMLLRSPMILDRAITKANLAALPSFQGEGGSVRERVRAQLAVTRPVKDSPLITLSFRGASTADSTLVLGAVIDSYRDFLEETYRGNLSGTIAELLKAREALESELKRKMSTYEELLKDAPLTKLNLDDPASIQTRLQAIESKKMALLLRRAEVRAKLAILEKGGGDDAKQRGSLKLELEENMLIENEVDQLRASELERAKPQAAWKAQVERQREEIERTRKMCEPLVKRLEELLLAKDLGGFEVVVLEAPRNMPPAK